ncbi:MAG: GxxExxY protein [Opitutus sp.]|nr:GxxExxY protein [Opitutus sp.]
MPIHCPIALPRLSETEMKEIDYQVMAHAFAAHRDLGRFCDEAIYQADLAERLAAVSLGLVHRELPITASFCGFVHSYFPDLVVAECAIYELKADATLTPAHEAQLLNYLLLANAARGKLINFRPASVESRFVNAPLDHAARHDFAVHRDTRATDDSFVSLVVDLVSDWGTGLETALYVRALTHVLGGDEVVIRQLPMTRAGHSLGNQRFHLAAPETAFILTSYSLVEALQQTHLNRLLEASPLARLIWVNIALHDLTFTAIDRRSRLI